MIGKTADAAHGTTTLGTADLVREPLLYVYVAVFVIYIYIYTCSWSMSLCPDLCTFNVPLHVVRTLL